MSNECKGNRAKFNVGRIKAKNRAARMLIESEGIKRERKMHDEYEQKIASVENELQSCLIHVDEDVDYKEEVTKLQDELYILQHNSGKLTHAEEQVQRLKQKIHQQYDIQWRRDFKTMRYLYVKLSYH